MREEICKENPYLGETYEHVERDTFAEYII